MLHALDHDISLTWTSFNALFQLDESAVVSHAQNAALDACANGIALRSVKPGIRRELLKPSETRSFSDRTSELLPESDRPRERGHADA